MHFWQEFEDAWNRMRDVLPMAAGLTVLFMLSSAFAYYIPFVGYLILSALYAGYMYSLLKVCNREAITYKDFFWAFTDINRLIQFVIINALVTLLYFVTFICFVIPFFWFYVAVFLSVPLMITDKVDSIYAIKRSVELSRGRWWELAVFISFIHLMWFAGVLCMFIGIIIATPISALMILSISKKLQPLPIKLNNAT